MKEIIWLSIVCFFAQEKDAHAYLDPGTGSFILQIVLGGVAAGFFLAKQYWIKIKKYFGLHKEEKDE